jgi:hypothetical protein
MYRVLALVMIGVGILGTVPKSVPSLGTVPKNAGPLGTLGTVPKNAGPLGTVPTVSCTVRGDAHDRVYLLDQTPGATPTLWRLSMRDSESGGRWIRLSLRGAQPQVAAGTASLTYTNANGGRVVTLDVKPGHASLDVFVDHGLEVNIEPDLDPAVDRMTTHGPLTSLDCTVQSQ